MEYKHTTQHPSFTYIFMYVSENWTLTALKDEELKRQTWSYWDLWQATPFMTTKQMTTYAANYGL